MTFHFTWQDTFCNILDSQSALHTYDQICITIKYLKITLIILPHIYIFPPYSKLRKLLQWFTSLHVEMSVSCKVSSPTETKIGCTGIHKRASPCVKCNEFRTYQALQYHKSNDASNIGILNYPYFMYNVLNYYVSRNHQYIILSKFTVRII